ncbi:hypothetical protein [Crossiella sp. CA198]|uniref:hypothetical protein n=1 Tax=Crossiella sp. CA198 TaxID=3455607 RepID=UPI003F8D898D
MSVKSIGVKVLTALALVGTVAVAAPATGFADEYLHTCDLSKKIDELQGWGADRSNNIIVYKDSARANSWFEGVVSQGQKQAMACNEHWAPSTFHWVVFKGRGYFEHKGDGGYRNWAFYGVFDRDGEKVNFHAR